MNEVMAEVILLTNIKRKDGPKKMIKIQIQIQIMRVKIKYTRGTKLIIIHITQTKKAKRVQMNHPLRCFEKI